MTDHPDTILQRRMMAQADEIRELKAQLAAALDKADKKQRAAKAMNQQRNEAEKALLGKAPADASQIIERLREQLEKRGKDVAHWQKKADKAGGEVARLSSDNADLRKRVRALTEDINSERGRADMLAERLRSHLPTARHKSGEVEQLQERVQ